MPSHRQPGLQASEPKATIPTGYQSTSISGSIGNQTTGNLFTGTRPDTHTYACMYIIPPQNPEQTFFMSMIPARNPRYCFSFT